MRVQSKAKPASEDLPSLHRRLRDLRHIALKLKRSRMTPLQVCEAIIEKRHVDPDVRTFFSGLPNDERHYWISSLYALLMPKARRRRLAAYFTPPHLAHHVIDLMIEAGIQPGRHRILDPASGGAAFLVPLAEHIAANGHRRGARAKTILQTIANTLHGVEIEPDLANLSHALLSDLLRGEVEASGMEFDGLVQRANTLDLKKPAARYDAVIGNPPYGRILKPSKALLRRYQPVIEDGYVNLYALFIEQSLQWVRPGGIVCLIVPMSFVGGPYFTALRKRIMRMASVLRLDLIDKRSDVFLDVLYDLSVLVLRRNDAIARVSAPKCSLIRVDEPDLELGNLDLPARPDGRVWVLPDRGKTGNLFRPGFETLQDYGYLCKTGYFVWNREKKRYRVDKKPRPNEVPLFWAHNIRANKPCTPHEEDGVLIGLARVPQTSSAIIRSDAILLQRTSNRRQKRRLIAAPVRSSNVIGGRGFVTENHTIVITRDPTKRRKLPLSLLCRLLNTAAVDARFRRVSGSVSVSTKGLRDLPLPAATDVRRFFTKKRLDDEEAATAAYAASTSRKGPARPQRTGRKRSRRRRLQ